MGRVNEIKLRRMDMAIKDYQKRAVKKYQDANYEFIKVRLNKGEKDQIKAKAEEQGKSINQYIRDCIL